MIKLLDLRIEHFAMLGRPTSGLFYDEFEDPNPIIKAYVSTGPGYTLMVVDDQGRDVEALACAGVTIPWEGVGDAWMIPGVNAKDHGLAVAVACRRGIERIARTFALHRVQALQVVDRGIPEKFYRAMGFETKPALLRKYTPTGKDCLLYERVFQWPKVF